MPLLCVVCCVAFCSLLYSMFFGEFRLCFVFVRFSICFCRARVVVVAVVVTLRLRLLASLVGCKLVAILLQM